MNPKGVQPWLVQTLQVSPLRTGFNPDKTNLKHGSAVSDAVHGLELFAWLENLPRWNSDRLFGSVELVCLYLASSAL